VQVACPRPCALSDLSHGLAQLYAGCRLYNTLTGSCLANLAGHDGEISKVSWNPQVRAPMRVGCQKLQPCNCIRLLSFSLLLQQAMPWTEPCVCCLQGTRILTASNDQTCRLWEAETGDCLQVLTGHTDEVFSCAFNYEGSSMITGSKDNTCRIWRAAERRESNVSDC
jgi:dynein assembly factor with WDR repeat domains 1